MSVEHHDDVSRRSVLKQAALGGAGLVAGSLLTGAGSGRESAAIERVAETSTWPAERASCVSGNRLLVADVGYLVNGGLSGYFSRRLGLDLPPFKVTALHPLALEVPDRRLPTYGSPDDTTGR